MTVRKFTAEDAADGLLYKPGRGRSVYLMLPMLEIGEGVDLRGPEYAHLDMEKVANTFLHQSSVRGWKVARVARDRWVRIDPTITRGDWMAQVMGPEGRTTATTRKPVPTAADIARRQGVIDRMREQAAGLPEDNPSRAQLLATIERSQAELDALSAPPTADTEDHSDEP